MVPEIRVSTFEKKIVYCDKDLILFERIICSLGKRYGLYMLRFYLEDLRLFDHQRYWIIEWKTYQDVIVPISPKGLFDWLGVKGCFVSFDMVDDSCKSCGLHGEECMRERHYNTCIVLNDEIKLEV